MLSPLPLEWRSWVDDNLARDPSSGANVLITLLDQGFSPLDGLEATGDFLFRCDERPVSITSAEICVLISSYRDHDCINTIVDLFSRARNPERISVAVFSQEEEHDRLCLPEELDSYGDQIRILSCKASDSRGACWARHHCQKLLSDEHFAFQIDSHMRFESDWDLLVLSTWVQCKDDRALLTAYPPGFTPGEGCEKGAFYGMAAREFNTEGILLFDGRPRFQMGADVPARPMAGAFISANFLFGPSSFVREVPYDPNLYFFGEEISLAVRLWTHGYNIYHPNRAILYCDWDRSKRSTHFDDHHDWSALAALAHARVRSLLGVSGREGDPAWPEDDLYGLGKFRSIMDYQDWSGIDFSAQTVSASALKGRFPASLMRTYSASARVLIEDDELIVVDDFLPDEDYKVLRDFLICEDYKHINSSGVIERAWHLQDRFPLRSETSWILSARESDGDKPDWMIPTGRPIDHFMQAVKDFQSDRVQRIGVCGVDWDQFSATGWIYPPGTGLAMHTDGANVYRGAYVYFMNDSWRSHWGGLLVVMDSTVNQYVEERQKLQDGMLWYRRRWLHENELESLMLDGGGMGRVVFPKANRIAFLGNKAYHMVTRINEESGDVLRLSLAGFFFVPKA